MYAMGTLAPKTVSITANSSNFELFVLYVKSIKISAPSCRFSSSFSTVVVRATTHGSIPMRHNDMF